MSMIFNNALDIRSKGIIVTIRNNLVFPVFLVFIFLMRDCCRKITVVKIIFKPVIARFALLLCDAVFIRLGGTFWPT